MAGAGAVGGIGKAVGGCLGIGIPKIAIGKGPHGNERLPGRKIHLFSTFTVLEAKRGEAVLFEHVADGRLGIAFAP